MNQQEIDEFLRSWYDLKIKRTELDKKLDKFKKVADKLIAEGILSSNKFALTKKNQSRRTISKNKVPDEVWNRYSTISSYPVYSLRKLN